jgi:hypothetical protein
MSWEELEVEEGRPRDELTVSVELWAREALSKGLTITRKLLVEMGASLKASRGILARLRGLEGTRAAWLAHGEIALSQPIDVPTAKLIAELKRWVEGSVRRLRFRAPQLCTKALCVELEQGVIEQPTLRWLPAWWGSPLLEALWLRPPPS